MQCGVLDWSKQKKYVSGKTDETLIKSGVQRIGMFQC